MQVTDRTLKDPIDAYQVNMELKEIKRILRLLPIYFGKGTPEGQIKASVGSIYLRLDGGTNTTLYVKESGSGVTGWVAK